MKLTVNFLGALLYILLMMGCHQVEPPHDISPQEHYSVYVSMQKNPITVNGPESLYHYYSAIIGQCAEAERNYALDCKYNGNMSDYIQYLKKSARHGNEMAKLDLIENENK